MQVRDFCGVGDRTRKQQVIIGTPTVESEHMAKMAVVHRDPVEASFLRAKKAPSLEPAPLKAMTEKDFDFINRMDNDVEGRRRTAFMEQLKKDPRFRPEMLEPAKSKFQVQRWLASAIVLRRVRGAHASLSPSLSVMCRLSRSWVGRSSRRTSQQRTGMRGRSTSGGRSAAGASPCPPHRIHAVNVHKLIVLLLLCAGIDIISSSSATAVLSVCRVIVGRIFLGAVSTSLSCD